MVHPVTDTLFFIDFNIYVNALNTLLTEITNALIWITFSNKFEVDVLLAIKGIEIKSVNYIIKHSKCGVIKVFSFIIFYQ